MFLSNDVRKRQTRARFIRSRNDLYLVGATGLQITSTLFNGDETRFNRVRTEGVFDA
jgi:hypothetical protein